MMLNPFDWTAGPFLELYLFLAVTALSWRLVRRSSIGPSARHPRRLNELEMALMKDEWRLGDAALFALLEAKAATVDARGRIDVASPAPLAAFVRRLPALHFAKGMTRGQFQTAIRPLIDHLREGLRSAGFVPSAAQMASYRMTTLIVVGMVVLFGTMKALIGASRGHPVGILVFLLAATVVLGLLLMVRPALTKAGSDALLAHARGYARAARAPLGEELLLAVALSGFAVLAGTEYAQALAATRAASGGSSGCGGTAGVSGCSGGGDGGGGGGGGGCGGCGS